jgi:hypothetical protein
VARLVAEADDLVLDGGAVARAAAGGPAAVDGALAEAFGDDPVGVLGRVGDAAGDLRVVIASVRNENGIGAASASCISSRSQAMVDPSRRAGVPVFRRPMRRPEA